MTQHPTQLLETALAAHRQGQFPAALKAYEDYLAHDALDPLALYGVASIKLELGDISGFPIALQCLTSPRESSLEKPLAADSLVRALLRHQYQDHAKKFLDACAENGIVLPNGEAFYAATHLPDYLAPTHYDPHAERELERYRPIESPHYVYAIDIVGGCNLRCPTCPVGQQALPKGLMTLEMFQKILAKIKTETVDTHADIWLFNWTEPMLHPEIETFITTIHEVGFTSFLSTNLNLGQRIEAVMRAAPTRLKVSLSSLSQDIYGQTHARGDIAHVVANLRELARWRDHYHSKTHIWIGHHLYRNTLAEQASIKALADELGFGYVPSPAIVAPIEKVLGMMEEKTRDEVGGLRDQLLFDPLDIRARMAKTRSGRKDCELRFNMTTLQYDGTVNLCCATTQALDKKPVHFLDHPHRELEEMKYNHSFCKTCMDANLHLTISDQ